MKNKKFLTGTVVTGFLGLTTISLSSCSFTTNGVMTMYSPTDYLASNNSPLNSSFNNSPISSYANSITYNLTTYQTTGNFDFSGDKDNTKVDSTIKDTLILEGASAVIVFENEDVMKKFDESKSISLDNNNDDKNTKQWLEKLESNSDLPLTKNNSESNKTPKNGENYWIFYRDKGGIQYQDNSKDSEQSDSNSGERTITTYYNNAISKGTIYQFLVDTDNQWVDDKGNTKAKLSSKDFERGVEAYALAAKLKYNRNGYFLDLLGMNFDKSVANKKSNSSTSGNDYANVASTDYNVEDYTSKNDNFYTLYITTPYPYVFDLISKEYFSAMPHTNQKVKNITLQGNSPIKYKESNGSKIIDETQTDWSRIYASGGLGQFTKDVWYCGAYLVSAFTSSKLVFELNTQYIKAIGNDLLDWDKGVVQKPKKSFEEQIKERIKTVSISYGSGSADTYYEMFKSHQNDYLAEVPSSKMSEAAKLFANKGLVPTKVVQTARSNYIAYTPTSYVVDSNTGTPRLNSYISENMGKLLYKWNSEESITVRAAVSGLVNYYQLSLLNLPGSGDFQLSATPYGVFSQYYESISEGNFLGALPRPYSDYVKEKSTTLGEFKIPYYFYSKNDISLKQLIINQETFRSSLQKLGATVGSPLGFSIKFGEGSFSTNYTSFLNKLKSTLETLSGGLLSVSIVGRSATTPSATDWYNSQASPLGYSYWMPDYNGVGTWIEAGTTLQSKTIDGKNYEGVSATNAHNSYLTYLQSMVTAVKKMEATWDSSTKKYVVNNLIKTNDPFKDDDRIQKAFSDTTLKSLGVSLKSGTSVNKDNRKYNESNVTDTGMSPGNRYGLLAIGLLNMMFENKVFKIDDTGGKASSNGPTEFKKYLDDPSLLVATTDTPSSASDVYRGGNVIADGQSTSFSKWIGVYSGEATEKALYENFVVDSDYNFVPRSESGLKDITYSLVNPIYVARVGTQSTNYRDFGMAK